MLQVCQYLMWRKSRPENKISAEVEEKVENAIQVWMIRQYQLSNTKHQPIIGEHRKQVSFIHEKINTLNIISNHVITGNDFPY